MRTPTLLLALPAALFLVAGCSGERTADVEGLAAQADRVAALLEDGEDCRAVEALHTLEDLAGQDASGAVRDAVGGFVASARTSLSCADDGTSPVTEQGDGGGDAPADPPPGQADEGKDGKPDKPDKPGKAKGHDK